MLLIALGLLIGFAAIFGRVLIETPFFRTGYALLVTAIPLSILGLILMFSMALRAN